MDESGTATKCPSCHTPKKDAKIDAAPKSHLPQCKALTEREVERSKVLEATGSLPQTTLMQEATKQAQKLRQEIVILEVMEGGEELMATNKKQLAALEPKLPVADQAVKDHSDVCLALKDLAENGTGPRQTSRKGLDDCWMHRQQR